MLTALKSWMQRRPWTTAAALAAIVLASTAVGALIHHAGAAFLLALLIVNAAHVALRFVDDPGADRQSLFLRRR